MCFPPPSRADQVTESVLVALATHAGVARHKRACECTLGVVCGGLGLCSSGGTRSPLRPVDNTRGPSRVYFDFRTCISDKVKIHADPRACIFDVVYFLLIDIFGVLCCRAAVAGVMEGLLGLPSDSNRKHQIATDSTR